VEKEDGMDHHDNATHYTETEENFTGKTFIIDLLVFKLCVDNFFEFLSIGIKAFLQSLKFVT
jgi:hypothetical protein